MYSIQRFKQKPPRNKGNFGLLSAIILGLSIFAPRFAHAGILDGIGEWIVKAILNFLFGIMLAMITMTSIILSMILRTIAWFLSIILDWSVELALNTPYTVICTGPGQRCSAVFTSGWPVVRDLANMGLIIILVAIGIGTMLSLRFDKSRLFVFFVVAILINFTPILTGMVIDFSNIAAHVFWESTQNLSGAFVGSNPYNDLGAEFSRFIETVTTFENYNKFGTAMLAGAIQSGASVLLFIVHIFAMLLLIFLFFARIIALSILVILSPIAFLGLIFNRGTSMRKLWDRWKHNFVQWSIIVIPLLFTMWLTGIFVNAASADQGMCDASKNPTFSGSANGRLNEDLTGALSGENDYYVQDEQVCRATQSFIAAGVMIFGIMISLKSSAEGSKMILGRGSKLWNLGVKKTKQMASAPGRAAARGARSSAQRMVAPRAQRYATKALNTRAMQTLAKIPLVGGAVRTGTLATQQKFVQQQQKMYRDASRTYDGLHTFEQLLPHLKTETDPYKLTALFKKANTIDNDKFRALIEDDKRVGRKLDKLAQITGLLEGKGVVVKKRESLLKKSPITGTVKSGTVKTKEYKGEISSVVEDIFKGMPDILHEDQMKELIGKMNTNEISKLSELSLKNPDVVKAIKEQGKESTDLLRKIGKSSGKMEAYNEGIQKLVEREHLVTEEYSKKGKYGGTVRRKKSRPMAPDEYEAYLRKMKDKRQLTEFEKEMQHYPHFTGSYKAAAYSKKKRKEEEGEDTDIDPDLIDAAVKKQREKDEEDRSREKDSDNKE